jgi:hypothetical protein
VPSMHVPCESRIAMRAWRIEARYVHRSLRGNLRGHFLDENPLSEMGRWAIRGLGWENDESMLIM